MQPLVPRKFSVLLLPDYRLRIIYCFFPVSEFQKGKLAINQDVHKFPYLEAGRMYFPFYIIKVCIHQMGFE
jgi:hypothetical protein